MTTTLTSKQPAEAYAVSFDFARVLGAETIASATVTAIDQADLVDVSTVVLDAEKQSNSVTVVYAWVQAGTSGHRYLITCNVVGSAGSLYELEAILPVEGNPSTSTRAYCTQDDILLRLSEMDLIQLTDDSNDGEINTDVVDGAIDAADAEIDFYCSAGYSVPFTAPPAIVKTWSIDIAIHNLYGRRNDVAIPENCKSRYESAIELLQKIQTGAITLGATLSGSSGPASTSRVEDRIFTIGKSGVTGTLDSY
jgi:phage gp36-like protein